MGSDLGCVGVLGNVEGLEDGQAIAWDWVVGEQCLRSGGETEEAFPSGCANEVDLWKGVEIAGCRTRCGVRLFVDLLVSTNQAARTLHRLMNNISLVGIVYKTWVTPIAKTDLFNTRTGIGPWSDRIGALAYALTPFTIMLCMRESVLSIVTGIPYQHFNFLHRWLGRIIFVQSFLHTLGWTLVEARFYQPQPKVYVAFITQQYAMFGVVAMFFITWLTLFSTQWAIRKFGYEFFKASHWIIAVLYIAACWGHWVSLDLVCIRAQSCSHR